VTNVKELGKADIFFRQCCQYYKCTREATYVSHNLEARSHNHCGRGKSISIAYSVCVCVCVCVSVCLSVCLSVCSPSYPSMQSACAVWYCPLWPVCFCHIFTRYLINGTIFGKKLLHTKCVFWFSVQVLSETFLRHTLRVCNTCYFSTAKVVTRTRLNATFILVCTLPVMLIFVMLSGWTGWAGTQPCHEVFRPGGFHYCISLQFSVLLLTGKYSAYLQRVWKRNTYLQALGFICVRYSGRSSHGCQMPFITFPSSRNSS
jgi:hypothetical protein